jgi:glutathione S-transferase
MPVAHVVLDELARLLGDEPYFAGAKLSLADLLVAPQIDFIAQTPEWAVLGTRHRNLVAWLERMNLRPSLKATTWARVAEMAKAG